MGYTFPMLAYYLTAAIAFTLGFFAAAVIINGRRAESGRDRAWLAAAIERFAAKCKGRPRAAGSTDEYVVERDDLEELEACARPAKPQAD